MRTGDRGFTLLEVLLSVAIISLIIGFSMPFYRSFQTRSDFSVSIESVANALQRAATYARGANGDSPWGVYFGSSQITLYKGAAYASRDSTYDEQYTFPTQLTTVSAPTEVVFAKMTGTPNYSGPISYGLNGETRTITINAKATVSY